MTAMKDYELLTHPFNVVLTAIQTNEIFQVVSLVLTIISVCVSLLYTIYKWYKRATSDGKITKEEVEDLKEEIKDKLEKDE